MTKTVERKYAMIRIQKGDYLLPSNSGKTLWRIRRYEETGTVEYDNGTKLTGDFWSCARYKTPLQEIPPHMLGERAEEFLDDWCSWVLCADTLRTRQEAIEEALSISERRGT